MSNSIRGWMFTSGVLIGIVGSLAYLLRDEKKREQVQSTVDEAKDTFQQKISAMGQNIKAEIDETAKNLEEDKKHMKITSRSVN